MNTIFFGTPRFAQIVLEKLIDSPYKPSLVITAPDAKVGRGQKLAPSPVKQTAHACGIEILQPKKLSEKNLKSNFSQENLLEASISNLKFDLAILVAYGKIIPSYILSLPKYGFVNVHPSLLPQYRGPSPIQSVILTGEEKTGVTIIKLDEEVDHGPILTKKKITISPDDTHASLIESLGKIGADLLLHTLPKYLEGTIKPKSQNHRMATFTKHITKLDGFIGLANLPYPEKLDRMIRAYYPWPTVWTKVDGKIIKFLPGDLIQPEGKKPMTIREFLNGYPQAKYLIEKLFSTLIW